MDKQYHLNVYNDPYRPGFSPVQTAEIMRDMHQRENEIISVADDQHSFATSRASVLYIERRLADRGRVYFKQHPANLYPFAEIRGDLFFEFWEKYTGTRLPDDPRPPRKEFTPENFLKEMGLTNKGE